MTSAAFIVKDKETGEEFFQPVIPVSEAMKAMKKKGFDEGSIDGYKRAEDIFNAKFFETTIVGDGSERLEFELPFDPQLLMLTGFYPSGFGKANCVSHFVADFASFAFVAGSSAAYSASSVVAKPLTSASIRTSFSTEDGVGVLTQITGATSTSTAFFDEDVIYQVMACVYTDKSDKDRITEYVNSLSGSGSVSLSALKVNGAFTDSEWQALTATKPNWTFTLK